MIWMVIINYSLFKEKTTQQKHTSPIFGFPLKSWFILSNLFSGSKNAPFFGDFEAT